MKMSSPNEILSSITVNHEKMGVTDWTRISFRDILIQSLIAH